MEPVPSLGTPPPPSPRAAPCALPCTASRILRDDAPRADPRGVLKRDRSKESSEARTECPVDGDGTEGCRPPSCCCNCWDCESGGACILRVCTRAGATASACERAKAQLVRLRQQQARKRGRYRTPRDGARGAAGRSPEHTGCGASRPHTGMIRSGLAARSARAKPDARVARSNTRVCACSCAGTFVRRPAREMGPAATARRVTRPVRRAGLSDSGSLEKLT